MTKIVRQRKEGEPRIIPNGDSSIAFEARIGAVVNFPVLEDWGEGYVKKLFEKYVRAPGTRIIALKNNTIYLQKEKRIETDSFEWRLPGGKVIDTFKDYKQYLDAAIPEDIVVEAAKKELQEEAGLTSESMSVFQKKVCGTTVEWDLYYVVAEDVEDYKLNEVHEEAEEMEMADWFTFDQIEQMCRTGEIDEGRTVAALLQFIHKQKNLD